MRLHSGLRRPIGGIPGFDAAGTIHQRSRNIENRSLGEGRRVLTPTGILTLNSGTGAKGMAMLVRLCKPLRLSPFVQPKLRRYLSTPNHAGLGVRAALAETGRLRPVIDKIYPLSETRAARERVESGHARGKVVVTI